MLHAGCLTPQTPVMPLEIPRTGVTEGGAMKFAIDEVAHTVLGVVFSIAALSLLVVAFGGVSA